MVAYLIGTGLGVWGVMIPVAWGWAIVNFVFWVGIGHAGTLISAILFLFRQQWRTSINRFAEAMTIFAVICAGLFPAIHVGRIWVVYWLAPYPNQMQMWPNFRSPLLWDVFAVNTYFLVSIMFWYVGMIPDLATLRDRAATQTRRIAYGILALGWRGSHRHWHRHESAYLILAALATPLVLSVHSVVSFGFAVAQLPGWHTTIFRPTRGRGHLQQLRHGALADDPRAAVLGLREIISKRHIENVTKIILVTGSMVGYLHDRIFRGLVQREPLRSVRFHQPGVRPVRLGLLDHDHLQRGGAPVLLVQEGPHQPADHVHLVDPDQRGDVVRALRDRGGFAEPGLFAFQQGILPTWVDILTFIGSFGLFFTLFLLFCRYLPMVAMAE